MAICTCINFWLACVVFRSNESAYKSSINTDSSLLNSVFIISLRYNKVSFFLIDICYHANVFWSSFVISNPIVLPIIKTSISNFRNVVIILFPATHFLCPFNKVETTALNRHNISVSKGNCYCGPSRSAPCHSRFHSDASWFCFLFVVNIKNGFIRSIFFIFANPRINKVNSRFSCSGHNVTPLCVILFFFVHFLSFAIFGFLHWTFS